MTKNMNLAPSDDAIRDLISRYLDLDHYNAQCDVFFEDTVQAAAHYLEMGSAAGLDPCRWFATRYYRAHLQGSINPFHHYLFQGVYEGRRAHPELDINDAVASLRQRDEDVLALIAPFFNAAYYRTLYPAETAHVVEPLRHYLAIGWRLGFDPSPDFITRYYLERSPDVRAADMNPLVHYARHGRAEGRRASPSTRPHLDPLPSEEVVRQNFDKELYETEHPDVARSHVDPVRHYLLYGWRAGFRPTRYFDPAFYRNEYADIARSDAEPFGHYLSFGVFEGREPCGGGERHACARLIAMVKLSRGIRPSWTDALVTKAFDASFYFEQYGDRLEAKIDPVSHFLAFGWKLGMDPAPTFSTNQYLSFYPDVAASGQNPFVHFLTIGRRRGRIGRIDAANPIEAVAIAKDPLHVAQVLASEVNADFYRSANADLSDIFTMDAVTHYVTRGAALQRDPSPEFSTSYYISTYPDATAGGINPLLHFVLWGRRNGLAPQRRCKAHPVAHPLTDAIVDITRLEPRKYVPDGTSADRRRLRVGFVVPDFSEGGGGHMTIFRMVRWLEIFGHTCVIFVFRADRGRTLAEREDILLKHYQIVAARIALAEEDLERTPLDCLLATSWETVYPVMHATTAKSRFYLVQDYEPLFSARGSEAILAEETYKQNIACLCCGDWLMSVVGQQFGRWARRFDLAFDRRVYFAEPAKPYSGPLRIAFYARVGTPRRAVELGFAALNVLAERGVGFVVSMFGSKGASLPEASFVYVDRGLLNESDLGDLYRGSDIGLCFSATNHSIVPKEMMACGLPLVELDIASTRAVFPAGTVRFAAPRIDAIADAIEALVDEPTRASQAAAALAWVDQFSWETSARTIEAALVERLAHDGFETGSPDGFDARDTALGYKAVGTKVHAAVIIPTLDAGSLLTDVLQAVARQRAPWPYEIIVIDSRSTDDTGEIVRKFPTVRLISIERSNFQHGRTRNYGIQMTEAPFVAFLTQDAKPYDDFWLYNLVTHLERVPEAAGTFGRHVAWPNASAFVKRDIDAFFAECAAIPLTHSKYADMKSWNADVVSWHQRLHYFSDNNSCLRRSVWDRFPFPEVDYGEDQAWAAEIIAAGLTKLYTPGAVVWHSHDYDEAQTLERSRIEAAFFLRRFGYHIAPRDLDIAIKRADADDTRWAFNNGISAEDLAWRQRLNAARMLGYWLSGGGGKGSAPLTWTRRSLEGVDCGHP